MKSCEAPAAGLPGDALAAIVGVLSMYPEVERVQLFGSRAKGNHRPGSDIDLFIEAPTLNPGRRLGLETRLDDLLLPWKIDVVMAHEVDNPELLAHVARVGITLLAKKTAKTVV